MASHFQETHFDRAKHVFHSPEFEEIIKDTIRFFNGTPVHKLPPPERFSGTGVYALYYIGKNAYYTSLYEKNRLAFAQPIYVGKAVPSGWRQSKNVAEGISTKAELYNRLKDHTKSIEAAKNLILEDFFCRFMILEGGDASLIATVEAALIRVFKPVWNSCLDGFGNHTPGAGRFNQAKSDWDVLHPGRNWAEKCTGLHNSKEDIEVQISKYLNND